MRFKSIFIITVFFPLLCLSQEQVEKTKDTVLTQHLNEVVVTATRTFRQLSSLPLPVQIVSKKELREVNRTRLNSILNEQTGLITVQNFIGGEGIQMQGLNSEYTLVLIDGVPLVGRSAGTLDISRVAVGNIKQIEIVKGASSSLYGSEALGGVINIITDTPKTIGFKGLLNYQYGTFNTHDANLNLDFKKEKYSINGFVNVNSSDGYDIANAVDVNTLDPYTNFTISAKLNYNLSDKTKLFASIRNYYQDQDYIPTQEEAGNITTTEWNTHLKVDHKYSKKWSSYFEFYATQYKANEQLNTVANNTLFSLSEYDEMLIRPEIRATFSPNDKNSFIGGIGLDHETLVRTDFATEPEFNSPYVYAQYDGNPNEKLNIILGARFDKHNEYKSQFSPKAAIRYALNDKISFKSSIGYGFKAPDFRQLFFNLSGIAGYTILGHNTVTTRIPEMIASGEIENENDIVVPLSVFESQLKPESSVSVNFGVDYHPIASLKLELNLFRNDIQDLIDTQLIANKVNGSGVYSYYNVNKAYTQGLEFNTSWRFLNNFRISGGYQLLFAKDKAAISVFENGEAFASVPGTPSFQLDKNDYFGLFNRSKHMANLKVFYTLEKYNINTNIRATYRSKYGLFDTNSNNYLDTYDNFVEAYTIWNWAINKTFNKNLEVGFGIDNIFDFTDPPESGGDSVFIGNIPGRIIYGNINIKL